MADRKHGVGRRRFVQSVALSGAALSPAAAQDTPAKPPAAAAHPSVEQTPLTYPRAFTGRRLAQIAFPLGGVGAGAIALGGRGQLRDWEIFNKSEKGKSPRY